MKYHKKTPVNKIVYCHHYGAGIDMIVHYASETITEEASIQDVQLQDVSSWATQDEEVATVENGVVTPVLTGAGGNVLIWCKSTTENCVEIWNYNVPEVQL